MFVFVVIWMAVAIGIALAVQSDMRRLGIHRAGLTRFGWLIACLCSGLLGGLAYLLTRPKIRRDLIALVWSMVGDASHPTSIRQQRLIELRATNIISHSIYEECSRLINSSTRDI